jgi:hypothetical protein
MMDEAMSEASTAEKGVAGRLSGVPADMDLSPTRKKIRGNL